MALYVVLAASQLGRRDLINDEMYTMAAVHHLGQALRETHGTMALYYVTLWPWAKVSESVVWLHLPSLVAMAVGVGFLVGVVERWAGPRTARWAGVFAASSAMSVRYGVELRSYALWAMSVAMAWYFLDRSIEGADRRSRWAFGACVVTMPLLHGLAAVVLLGFGVAIAWARPPRQVALALGAPVLVGLGTVGLLLAHGAGEIGTHPPLGLDQLRRLLRGLVFPGVRPAVAIVVVASVGAWLMAMRPARSPSARLRQVGLVIWGPGTTLALLGLSLVRPSLEPRYAIPSVFGLAGLLAVAVTHPWRWRAMRFAPVLLTGLLLVGQGELRLVNHQWRSATAYVSERSLPGDGIAFVPADTRLAFEASLADRPRPGIPMLVGTGTELGTFDRFGSSESAHAVAEEAVGRSRLWVVSIRGSAAPNRAKVEDLLAQRRLREVFRIVARQDFHEVTIWRLERFAG